MKKQTAESPVKGNNSTVKVQQQEQSPLFMYGTITKGKGNKQTVHRAVVAGHLVSPTAMRIGVSVCSIKDRFIKSKGKVIALGRAKSKSEVQDILYITEDLPITKQFVSRASKLIVPTPKKGSKSVEELVKLN